MIEIHKISNKCSVFGVLVQPHKLSRVQLNTSVHKATSHLDNTNQFLKGKKKKIILLNCSAKASKFLTELKYTDKRTRVIVHSRGEGKAKERVDKEGFILS